jgi:hypothetical protein
VRDRDERHAHSSRDWRDDHHRARLAQRGVEADEGDEQEEAGEDGHPRSDEEEVAAVAYVGHPL